VHVKFTLNTPDGLRRVTFELERDSPDDSTVEWTITFQLFERVNEADQFVDPIVDLRVEVDSNLHGEAQVMADNGMTPVQAAFALGPAADVAKNDNFSDAKKQKTIQRTLKS
jgi:hypothetical protein